MKKISLFLLLCLMTLQSCVVGYGRYPRHQLRAPLPQKEFSLIRYRVEGTGLYGGQQGIKDAFKEKAPFKQVEAIVEKPSSGLFVDVHVKNVSPSIPSFAFGYLSVCFLTLTPAWTTKGGADIIYDLYKDGQPVQTFDYQVRQRGMLWIVMLPFVWVNLLTASESDAFGATARQFFEDARPKFS